RITLLSPDALLARLGERLDLVGRADHPQRQRTLRATLDWSHELLDDDARELFARLAVFSGGWTLEAAEAVCAVDDGPDVLDTLASLIDKGLVSIDERGEGEPRFRMLETVREYAGERLRESPARDAVRRRHAEYFVRVCEQAAQHFYGRARGAIRPPHGCPRHLPADRLALGGRVRPDAARHDVDERRPDHRGAGDSLGGSRDRPGAGRRLTRGAPPHHARSRLPVEAGPGSGQGRADRRRRRLPRRGQPGGVRVLPR